MVFSLCIYPTGRIYTILLAPITNQALRCGYTVTLYNPKPGEGSGGHFEAMGFARLVSAWGAEPKNNPQNPKP